MSTTSALSGVFHQILAQPMRGVVGLVDDILAACRDHSLQLDWQADRCRVRSLGSDAEELIDLRLRKSAFRSLLARVAGLCNERSPNSVSPYGGQGELSVGPDPETVFHVTFVNTPGEQRLVLTPVGPKANSTGRIMAKLKGVKIEAPPDFTANLD